MEKIKNSIIQFINLFSSNHDLCDHHNCLISSVRGLRNGIYYGGKVRFIHSLVIEILFGKNNNLMKRMSNIIRPTIEHATNLGIFAFIYKICVCFLRRIFKTKNKFFNFIAGLIGAFFMWSKKTNVNMQIMLYLLSRNILAIANVISEKFFPNMENGFTISSLLVWGVVMFLFEYQPKSLQNSLFNSMKFIYKDSDISNGWRDFIPFYIPNNHN